MKTQHTPLIEVHIPDYDTSFTYRLVFGDLCSFSDGNRLELADRAQLTDLVSVVNAKLITLNQTIRDRDELLAALKSAAERMEAVSESLPVEKRAVGVSQATHVAHLAGHLFQHSKRARAAIAKATGKE